MKALIRNNGETVLESAGIEGIDWTTGAPLTNPAWCGGPYALCEDCPVSDPEPQDFDITEVQVPGTPSDDPEEPPAEPITRLVAVFNTARYEARKAQEVDEADPAPIIIDGVEYTRVVGE